MLGEAALPRQFFLGADFLEEGGGSGEVMAG
jgi:hypothetical protein